MGDFDWPIRVYYEDTDTGGVVYHSQYLNFMERARTEWLRSLGFEQDVLIEQHHCIFAVHSMQINFKRPARFNDALLVRSQLTSTSGASLSFEQKVFCENELLCQAVVKVACLDSNRFRPMPIPSFILVGLQGEC
jgi:acyl-CoA thioester hydrolase